MTDDDFYDLDVPEVAFTNPGDPDPPVIEELRDWRGSPPSLTDEAIWQEMTGGTVLPFRRRGKR